jgi:hypothetical protein
MSHQQNSTRRKSMNKNNANEITVRYEIIGHNYRLFRQRKDLQEREGHAVFFRQAGGRRET